MQVGAAFTQRVTSLSKRRYTTHAVSFTLARRAAQLKPGDIIRVDLALDTTDGAGITDSIFYQIESLQEGQSGSVAIEAMHFPVVWAVWMTLAWLHTKPMKVTSASSYEPVSCP